MKNYLIFKVLGGGEWDFWNRWAVKTLYLLQREASTFSSKTAVFLCIPSARGPLPPRIWDHKLVSDVSAPSDFRRANFLLEIQATSTLMSITLAFGNVFSKFGITRDETLDPNFVTEFVDLVKNTGIFKI